MSAEGTSPQQAHHSNRTSLYIYGGLVAVLVGLMLAIGTHADGEAPRLFSIRAEFFAFAFTLFGVALFHHWTLQVALSGLTVVLAMKLGFDGTFNLAEHLGHERDTIINLLGLLLGFALLAKHFEASEIPQILPRFLPNGWTGGLVLLLLIAVISSFLDNIAAAMIGGTIASVVFKKRVHIGYLAAIVAASNAGGAPSVVGDTTTTMMWLEGVRPEQVIECAIAASVAVLFCGTIAARQQHKLQPIQKDADPNAKVNWGHLFIVMLILAGAIATNFLMGLPAAGVWAALLIGATFRKTAWGELPGALRGSVFLLSLVLCASMMPVNELPAQSWQTALGLGFLSAVFDNIPLTKLALEQNNYDWGYIAYAVGFGGSMIWFGSSAGVALANMYPEARSVGNWLRHGWHIAVGYVLGFFVMLAILDWHPEYIHPKNADPKSPTEHHSKTVPAKSH